MSSLARDLTYLIHHPGQLVVCLIQERRSWVWLGKHLEEVLRQEFRDVKTAETGYKKNMGSGEYKTLEMSHQIPVYDKFHYHDNSWKYCKINRYDD